MCIENVENQRKQLLLSVCMYSDSRDVNEDTQPSSSTWSTFSSVVILPPTMSAFHPAATESIGSTSGLPNQRENYFDEHMHSQLQFKNKSKCYTL